MQTSANLESMHRQLEKCARRFHEYRVIDGAAEHKYWKFEHCPADSCAEARRALGMQPPAEMELNRVAREPGEEG